MPRSGSPGEVCTVFGAVLYELIAGTPAFHRQDTGEQRFLVEVTEHQRAPQTSISIVLNWPALLKQ